MTARRTLDIILNDISDIRGTVCRHMVGPQTPRRLLLVKTCFSFGKQGE